MARPNGVVIVSERHWAFATRTGELHEGEMPSRRSGAARLPLVRGVMQLVVGGDSTRGANASVALKPVAVSVVHYQSLRGSLPLPPDFKPNQATILVLDRIGGHQHGMRVMLVK